MIQSKKLKFPVKKYRELANAIRILTADAVEKAQSGHPGMPLGMADVATVLFAEFLKYSTNNPNWSDRDRFILSAGHGAMLQYATMYLAGYNSITLEDIKNFRQLGSVTSGHPENFLLEGIETTTGPLAQGLANAVGMAIAERINNATHKPRSHKTYVIAGDGCLMEGLSHEAASLAGHLKLSNLILLYDSNDISIDGSTDLTFSDNIEQRFVSYNWNYLKIDGHDFNEIHQALLTAQTSDKPIIVECKTRIGYGAPNKEGSAKSHGAPLGRDEVVLMKQNLDIKNLEPFAIDAEILESWRNEFNNTKTPRLSAPEEVQFIGLKELIKQLKQQFLNTVPKEATRVSSKKILAELQKQYPHILGGSADLSGSNGVLTEYTKPIEKNDFNGNFIHYGVREHAMAAIMNGIALYGGKKVFGATFLAFLDYMKAAVRLSALMKLPVTYIFTHDSIGVGEDGPTHQPVEQLSMLRAIPNLICLRPSDAIETAECWEVALGTVDAPTALCLTRQALPLLRRANQQENLSSKGAYIISEATHELQTTIFASGSEVNIALDAQQKLEEVGVGTRVVSVPSFELFDLQEKTYKMDILCNSSIKIAVEAASSFGWEKYIGSHGAFVGMNDFGLSAPATELYKYFNITSDEIVTKVQNKLRDKNDC